jgi:hypothetical protein
MAKKSVTVSLRKPPPSRIDADAFVSGTVSSTASSLAEGVDGAPSEAPTLPPPSGVKASPVRSGRGRSFRELVFYLPEDLAERFSLYCAELDRDVGSVLAELVRDQLGRLERDAYDKPRTSLPVALVREVRAAVVRVLREHGYWPRAASST